MSSALKTFGHHACRRNPRPAWPCARGSRRGWAQQLVLEQEVEVLVVALLPPLVVGEGDHLRPELLGHAFARDLDEVAVGVELRVAVVVDLEAPGDHLQGGGHVGLGGVRLVGDLAEPLGAVARGAVLGAADLVGHEDLVDLGGEVDLDAGAGRLDAVGGAVVERDPVGGDAVGIEPLDEEQRLVRRGEAGGALDLADLGLQSGPRRDAWIHGEVGEQVLVVGLVGRVDGDGRDARLEHAWGSPPGPARGPCRS